MALLHAHHGILDRLDIEPLMKTFLQSILERKATFGVFKLMVGHNFGIVVVDVRLLLLSTMNDRCIKLWVVANLSITLTCFKYCMYN